MSDIDLKSISKEGVPAALEKADKYRLLNEPWASESICLDILKLDPGNEQALTTLLLALTDQFSPGYASVHQAREVLSRLQSPYLRAYYAGIICERWGSALLKKGAPGSHEIAYDWLLEAMENYEKAEENHPAGNDDATLRWNSCARVIARYKLSPRVDDRYEQRLE